MKLESLGLDWARTIFRAGASPGAAPGAIIVDPEALATTIHAICYGPEGVMETEVEDIGDLDDLVSRWPVVWLNVCGLGDAGVLESIGAHLEIHPLAVADIVNVSQRAKVESYEDWTFMILRQIEAGGGARGEQLGLALGDGLVVTFQERPGDSWDPVRRRIRDGRGRIRKGGADYLLYALVDSVVDHYFPVLEDYIDRVEALEDEVLNAPVRSHVARIQSIKHEFQAMRRDVWPLREAVSVLLRDELPQVKDETRTYLRDCHDHVMQLFDTMEGLKDMGSSLTDIYLSNVSIRANDVMRMLTIVATIFIPLTFIAGLYGMNFDTSASAMNMPELGWAWGYPACLGVMLAFALVLLALFRTKGWIGPERTMKGGSR